MKMTMQEASSEMAKDRLGLLLFLLSLYSSASCSWGSDVILPFGTGQGDVIMAKGDETVSGAIRLSEPFFFFNTKFDKLYVNVNGVVSFGDPLSRFSTVPLPGDPSAPFAAPFWGDVDTRDRGLVAYRQLSWLDGESDTIFNEVNDIVRSSFVDQQDFAATWMFVATWKNVGFNGQIDFSILNTFQVVLVTGDWFSGVIFHYDALHWTSDPFSGANAFTGRGGVPAQVGFSAGDGKLAYSLPVSQTDAILNLTETSNVNAPGRYVFRVDRPEVGDPACRSSGEAILFPRIGTLLGGNRVFISGPCFNNATDLVVCRFGITLSRGTVESALRAWCVTPPLLTMGDVAVEISVDGGTSYPFKGYYQVEQPGIKDVFVYKVNEEAWHTSNEIEVSWNTGALTGVSTVNIVVYSYREGDETVAAAATARRLNVAETLVGNVSFLDGGATVMKPAVDSASMNHSRDLIGPIGVVEVINGSDSDTIPRLPRVLWSEVGSLQWLYLQNPARWCAAWTERELELDLDFLADRPPCPCTLRQARGDFARYRVAEAICGPDSADWPDVNCALRPGAVSCFHATLIRRGAGQECCYDNQGRLIEDLFADDGYGHAQRHHATMPMPQASELIPSPFFSHIYNDVIPEMQCCGFSRLSGETGTDDGVNSCRQFRTLRPSQSCTDYDVPTLASVVEGAHFTALDGFNFTLEDQGEFTLLHVVDQMFAIQGRFEQIDEMTSASHLTAIAIGQGASYAVHIEPSYRRLIDVFLRRGNGSFSMLDSSQSHSWYFGDVSVSYGNDISRDGVRLSFSNGIGVNVWAPNGERMRFVLKIPSELTATSSGLLGIGNGEVPNPVQLAEDRVTPEESMFYYVLGYSTVSFAGKVPNGANDFELHANADLDAANESHNATNINTTCLLNASCLSDRNVTMGNTDFNRMTALPVEAEVTRMQANINKANEDPLLCPEVKPPVNGYASSSSGRDIGQTVLFACEDCYLMTGDSMLTCESTRRWNTLPPVCYRDADTLCKIPGAPQNGFFKASNCSRSIVFTCEPGFQMIGQKEITCKNTSWSHDVPSCQAAKNHADADKRNLSENPRIEKAKSKFHFKVWLVVLIVVLIVLIAFLIVCFAVTACRRRNKTVNIITEAPTEHEAGATTQV